MVDRLDACPEKVIAGTGVFMVGLLVIYLTLSTMTIEYVILCSNYQNRITNKVRL